MSLLLVITQVFEIFVKDGLSEYIKKTVFFSGLDYGFKNFHSTFIFFTILVTK